MTPKEIIQKWVEAFNRVDIEALMDLYADDAVNHQVVFEPLSGKEKIRLMFAGEFAKAKMIYIVEHIFEESGYWDQLSFLRQHKRPLPIE